MNAKALELAEIEARIEKNVRSIWVGLLQIREKKLYLADPQYKTWENYCAQRWGYSKQYVGKQLAFQRALQSGTIGPDGPITEGAFRKLGVPNKAETIVSANLGETNKTGTIVSVKPVFNAGIKPQHTRNRAGDDTIEDLIWRKFDEWIEQVINDLPTYGLTREIIIGIILRDQGP